MKDLDLDLDEAPEGATHVDDLRDFYDFSDMYNVKIYECSCWIETGYESKDFNIKYMTELTKPLEYTKAMYDAGEPIQVGMKFLSEDIERVVAYLSKLSVGFVTESGLLFSILKEDVKPINEKLIEGAAYSFKYKDGTRGIGLSKFRGFKMAVGFVSKSDCTDIKQLT